MDAFLILGVAMAFKPENCAGIYAVWNQIALLEKKRLHVADHMPPMARAIERKILRRARILAMLINKDKQGDQGC